MPNSTKTTSLDRLKIEKERHGDQLKEQVNHLLADAEKTLHEREQTIGKVAQLKNSNPSFFAENILQKHGTLIQTAKQEINALQQELNPGFITRQQYEQMQNTTMENDFESGIAAPAA